MLYGHDEFSRYDTANRETAAAVGRRSQRKLQVVFVCRDYGVEIRFVDRNSDFCIGNRVHGFAGCDDTLDGSRDRRSWRLNQYQRECQHQDGHGFSLIDQPLLDSMYRERRRTIESVNTGAGTAAVAGAALD